MKKELIIVTGANNGIGLECVNQFLTSGYKVAAISRTINNLNCINNGNLKVFKCDVTDYEALKDIINEIIRAHKEISGLINNAGVAFNGEFEKIDHENIQQMIDLNIKGFTNVLELILPNMQQNKKGTIINLSSLADRNIRPLTAVYAATKAYVKSISDSLRKANAKYNIRITNVAPASINTPLLAKLRSTVDSIDVKSFVNILKFIYEQHQEISIRDIVIAPTSYEG